MTHPTMEAMAFLDKDKIPYETHSSGLIVRETIDLSNRDLKNLPDLRCVLIMKGDFRCDNNELTSLFGSPRGISSGSFYCHDNKLTSLEYGPENVHDGYYCNDNDLETLKGAAPRVKGFDCRCNPRLTSLMDGPERALSFDCRGVALKDLSGCPRSFETLESNFGTFDCFADIPLKLAYGQEEIKKIVAAAASGLTPEQASNLNDAGAGVAIKKTQPKVRI